MLHSILPPQRGRERERERKRKTERERKKDRQRGRFCLIISAGKIKIRILNSGASDGRADDVSNLIYIHEM